VTTRLHLGFSAASRAAVDAFWRAGVDAGHPSDGEPGPRPQYLPDYDGAFLLGPDGSSAEAVAHGDLDATGGIDHLWWRVADLDASRRFYADAGARAGFAEDIAVPGRIAFSPGPGRGTFSIVAAGEQPTTPFDLAFPAPEPAVLRDPDGHTVKLVRR